jgi:hypothetical protein
MTEQNMWHRTIDKRRWRRWLGYGVAAAAALMGVAFLSVCWTIGAGVRATGKGAILEHGGDRVTALMTYLESSSHSLPERNRAVWALGQLGDARALPVLQKYYTGKPCDHGRMLCQRELKKAIQLCRGGMNLTAAFWRHRFFLD